MFALFSLRSLLFPLFSSLMTSFLIVPIVLFSHRSLLFLLFYSHRSLTVLSFLRFYDGMDFIVYSIIVFCRASFFRFWELLLIQNFRVFGLCQQNALFRMQNRLHLFSIESSKYLPLFSLFSSSFIGFKCFKISLCVSKTKERRSSDFFENKSGITGGLFPRNRPMTNGRNSRPLLRLARVSMGKRHLWFRE